MNISNWLKYWHRKRTRHVRVRAAENSFQSVLKTLSKQDVCIDCGANVGKYTLLMAMSGAQVHAFEPDPEAFRELSQTVAAFENVKLWNVAVGNADKEIPIYRSRQLSPNSANHTTSTSVYNESYRVEKESDFSVKQIDFGKFIDALDKNIKLLKMDIEGAEVDVLEMLFQTKRIKKIGHIFVETHEK